MAKHKRPQKAAALPKAADAVIPHTPVVVKGMNAEQKAVIASIEQNKVSIVYGPAGTGKTFLAVSYALRELLAGRCYRIIFTRPCVEAYGERMGYLPGDSNQKLSPYMMPLMDVVHQYINRLDAERLVAMGKLITLPMAFLRGLTFRNSIVVADETQNTLPMQMRLLLTRLGKDSKIIVTGDLVQSDIMGQNGLADAVQRLTGVQDLGICPLTINNVVRDPIVAAIERRYMGEEKNQDDDELIS